MSNNIKELLLDLFKDKSNIEEDYRQCFDMMRITYQSAIAHDMVKSRNPMINYFLSETKDITNLDDIRDKAIIMTAAFLSHEYRKTADAMDNKFSE